MKLTRFEGPSPIYGTRRVDFTDGDLAIWHEGAGSVSTPYAWEDQHQRGVSCWLIDPRRAYVNEWTHIGESMGIEYMIEVEPEFEIRSACAAYCARSGYGDVVQNEIAS